MLCPYCDEELVSLRCPTCGREWKNSLMVFGDKHSQIAGRISHMTIQTNRDCLPLLAELSNLDAAYAEIVDALTNGDKI